MKKFFGILLIVISALIALLLIIASLPLIFSNSLKAVRDPSLTSISMLAGNLLGFVLFMLIPGLLLFFGLKLRKRPKEIVVQEEY